MFSKALTSLAAVALLTTMVRADYSIVEPVEGTKWVPGETVTISWIEVPGTTTPAKISLALMVGDPALLQESEIIASDVDSSAGTYKWTVPETIQPSTQYAVRAGNGDAVKYSHYFDVQGDDSALVNAAVVGPSSEAASETTSASQASSTGAPASSGTSVSAPATAPTSSTLVSGSSSAAVSGTSKASVSPSFVSPSSAPTGAPAKPSGASSLPSGGPAKSASSANSSPTNTGESAGNALTMSGITALIPAALVAFLRQ